VWLVKKAGSEKSMDENVSEPSPDAPGGTLSDVAQPERVNTGAPRKSKVRARLAKGVSLVGLVIVVLLLWHFLGAKTDKAASRPRSEVIPVEIVAATQMDVPVQIKSIGNVEPVSTIAVRSQIPGTLQAVRFTPGQEVKKGDLLFMIDPRPLQAALSQAEANLAKAMAAVSQGKNVVARDQATATNSRTIAKRDLQLVEAGVVSREEYDNAVAKADADDATVRADQNSVATLDAAAKAEQANVSNAVVQLSYTSIRAPLTGKTGNLVTTTGNLIQANDPTPMVTITQAAPVYVTFTVPEQDLLRIRQYANSVAFKTEVSIPGDEANPPQQGKLSLVDNTVDTTTGTIRLKATLDNGDRKLFPGLFVNVVLTLGVQREAVVVPSQAVQIGQDNSYVYVAKPDMTAEVRVVKTGTNLNNLTVIEEGIKAGEQVITDGQLKLVPGATVQAKSAQPKSGKQGAGSANQGSNAQPAVGGAPTANPQPTNGYSKQGDSTGGKRGP
jgi:multidrug efflux system membrane fusion protein